MSNSNTSPLAQAYLRFLHLAKTVDGNADTPSLGANERALLEALAMDWDNGTPMTVMQAMALKHLGSPATLHRRITRLRKLGLIQPQEDEQDTRIKRLILTASARKYFEQMGETLKLATAR